MLSLIVLFNSKGVISLADPSFKRSVVMVTTGFLLSTSDMEMRNVR